MTPVAFDGATRVMKLIEPASQVEACERLPVRIDGGQVVSCWRPSPAELEEIIATGLVWLAISASEVIPRVHVTGHKAEAFG